MKNLKMAFVFASIMVFGLTVNSYAQQMGKQTVAQLKESPAGSKIITFINTVNKGEAVSDEFIQELMSEALIKKAGLGQLKNIMENDIPENDGKLTVYMVDRKERFKYEVYAKGTASEGWLKLEFFMDETRPYKIKGIGIDGTEAPEGVGEPMKID